MPPRAVECKRQVGQLGPGGYGRGHRSGGGRKLSQTEVRGPEELRAAATPAPCGVWGQQPQSQRLGDGCGPRGWRDHLRGERAARCHSVPAWWAFQNHPSPSWAGRQGPAHPANPEMSRSPSKLKGRAGTAQGLVRGTTVRTPYHCFRQGLSTQRPPVSSAGPHTRGHCVPCRSCTVTPLDDRIRSEKGVAVRSPPVQPETRRGCVRPPTDRSAPYATRPGAASLLCVRPLGLLGPRRPCPHSPGLGWSS